MANVSPLGGSPSGSIVLRDRRDEGGVRRLVAMRRQDGGIVIEGQDLGPGVEEAWGAGLTEYEWDWVVEPDAVPAMIVALGGAPGADPLILLAAWMAANGDLDPGIRLREAGVPVAFWSRVGD